MCAKEGKGSILQIGEKPCEMVRMVWEEESLEDGLMKGQAIKKSVDELQCAEGSVGQMR